MRFLRQLLLSLALLSSQAVAQDAEGIHKASYDYQSDVSRLRKIVINSLYSHKEIFLRELLSNANDAIEKLRLTALKDEAVWDGVSPLNITIQAIKNPDGPGGKLVISDTGIGMTPLELANNLGTLAKSGTTEFLAKAEAGEGSNLIGAFGLGFYSSFLVADQVYVASLPPQTPETPKPKQHVFSSHSDEGAYQIYEDPRGNTLDRGTEITLVLKDDSFEYLDTAVLKDLVNKHSSFSSTFPIYIMEQRTEQVPDLEAAEVIAAEAAKESEAAKEASTSEDEDTIIVEDVPEPKAPVETPMKTVVVDEWVHLNSQPPIWTRDPKTVTDEEYIAFYQATYKDHTPPLAWQHFSGDSGSGVSFKGILYVPATLPSNFWQDSAPAISKDIKLMVKRVFITSELGDGSLPKWASWLKVVVDAEDLPLNVSRETLQNNAFLKQMRQIILKRLIQLFTRLEKEDEEKFKGIQEQYGSIIKLGAIEDAKNRDKLVPMMRFATNQRNLTSYDQYIENKKQGQKQIFYLADLGKPISHLAASVFVEKLDARGYEVFLLNEPLDEVLIQNLRKWKNLPFQDIAKAGLQFGDEDADAEEEKAAQAAMKDKFKPLLTWLKEQAKDVVRDVTISNRLVSSPCAIVADQFGYTANVEKLMMAGNSKENKNQVMNDFAKKQKLLEVNPRSPLIEGLLRRVEQLPTEDEGRDLEAEEELKEVASILIDGALVRSGFEVTDATTFFTRVDRVLRRSLGVSETAQTDTTVKPAPPVDPELPAEDEPTESEFMSFMDFQKEMKEKEKREAEAATEGEITFHDEL